MYMLCFSVQIIRCHNVCSSLSLGFWCSLCSICCVTLSVLSTLTEWFMCASMLESISNPCSVHLFVVFHCLFVLLSVFCLTFCLKLVSCVICCSIWCSVRSYWHVRFVPRFCIIWLSSLVANFVTGRFRSLLFKFSCIVSCSNRCLYPFYVSRFVALAVSDCCCMFGLILFSHCSRFWVMCGSGSFHFLFLVCSPARFLLHFRMFVCVTALASSSNFRIHLFVFVVVINLCIYCFIRCWFFICFILFSNCSFFVSCALASACFHFYLLDGLLQFHSHAPRHVPFYCLLFSLHVSLAVAIFGLWCVSLFGGTRCCWLHCVNQFCYWWVVALVSSLVSLLSIWAVSFCCLVP